MKYIIIHLVFLFASLPIAIAQNTVKFDFSEAVHEEDLVLLKKKIEENTDIVIDSNSYTKIRTSGMYYANVPLISTIFSDNTMKIIADTLPNAASRFLHAVENKKGLAIPVHTLDNQITFEWDTETEHSELAIQLVNGEHLAALGDSDIAYLTTTFKTVYNAPLAHIHEKITKFSECQNYKLLTDAIGCSYTIFIDDIIVSEFTEYDFFDLNPFITAATSKIKILVRPTVNKRGKISKIFDENSYFSAIVSDFTTGRTGATIEKTELKGAQPQTFEITFDSKLPYYPEAWTNGEDLRDDEDIKTKISAFYQKIGDAFIDKNESLINDLFYQKQFEVQQSYCDSDFEPNRSQWQDFLRIQRNSSKFTVAKNFDIQFYAHGKLLFASPKKQNKMLIFSGDSEYKKELSFFMYRPNGSDQLKIIR